MAQHFSVPENAQQSNLQMQTAQHHNCLYQQPDEGFHSPSFPESSVDHIFQPPFAPLPVNSPVFHIQSNGTNSSEINMHSQHETDGRNFYSAHFNYNDLQHQQQHQTQRFAEWHADNYMEKPHQTFRKYSLNPMAFSHFEDSQPNPTTHAFQHCQNLSTPTQQLYPFQHQSPHFHEQIEVQQVNPEHSVEVPQPSNISNNVHFFEALNSDNDEHEMRVNKCNEVKNNDDWLIADTQSISRRTKSTTLPTQQHSLAPVQQKCSVFASPSSLNRFRFHSQLRSHPADQQNLSTATQSIPLLKPYTPPPILSPMRSGAGLFCSLISANKKFSVSEERKQLLPKSVKSETRMVAGSDALMVAQETAIASRVNPTNQILINGEANKLLVAVSETQERLHMSLGTINTSMEGGESRKIRDENSSGNASRPPRKNGLTTSGFSAELEALRKQSAQSTSSVHSITGHKLSMMSHVRNKLSITDELILRKMSSVSMDDDDKKEGDTDENFDSDGLKNDPELESVIVAASPHINLGKPYQAKVNKWKEREVSSDEREAILDRDEIIFSPRLIDHIPQIALAAYEALACSVAIPRPGRNKEVALHILMENKGNLQAACTDLMRSDTLDWEQYPTIFNNLYTDVHNWTPEEITCFQDAIYKSEKEFHQVAAELNRPVNECIAFYYTWKKCCPDDYRKLRNLRRKRQLLEQQLDYVMLSNKMPPPRTENNAIGDSTEDISETESDVTNPELSSIHCSPSTSWVDHSTGAFKQRVLNNADSNKPLTPMSLISENGSLRFNDPLNLIVSQSIGQCQNSSETSTNSAHAQAQAYPWLHCENGLYPSPTPSSASMSERPLLSKSTIGVKINHPRNDAANLEHYDRQLDSADSIGSKSNDSLSFLHKIHRTNSNSAIKKGAQPSNDGFFHCRLCEKKFEKVKSLNAHMKSHAMKARAEAEAQSQQKSLGQAQQIEAALKPFKPVNSEMLVNGGGNGIAAQTASLSNILNPSAAAIAALSRLTQQQQQQQFAQGLETQQNLFIRNMLQRHVAYVPGSNNEWLTNAANQFAPRNHQ